MSELCSFFMNGKCKKKEKCKFIHDNTLCSQFYQSGKCEKESCSKKHVLKEIYSQLISGTQKNTQKNDEISSVDGIETGDIKIVKTKKKLEMVSPKNQKKENSKKETPIENSEKIEKKKENNKKKPKKKVKNTESFDPNESQSNPHLRIMMASSTSKYKRKHSTRDVVVHPNLFCEEDDLTIYKSLLKEIEQSKLENVWKSWHGDSHQIVNDRLGWKKHSPTFQKVIEKIEDYFGMKINATRLNWYKDSSEWKPFHHDSAAVKKEIAKIQNFTVGVSFGQERDISLEHVKAKTKVSIPLLNGHTYSFAQKINTEWKHGVPQMAKKPENDIGRISIIAWGWVDQEDLLEQYSKNDSLEKK
eukprot:gene10734-3354_t